MADPRALRAIAHPIRARILDELRAAGSLRAADVAAELGIPANSASFHLRQLAKYDVVREDASLRRDGRDRVWVATEPEGMAIDISALEREPGGKAASRAWRNHWRAWSHAVVDAAYADGGEPDTFRAVTTESIKLTKAEAQELGEAIDALLRDLAARPRGPAERRTYLLLSMLQPYPDTSEGTD